MLPALHDILKDVQLTQDIGWDLVEMFVPLLPGSEACLDDVARLGNPREVILKVLEVLEDLKTGRRRRPADDEDGRGEGEVDEDEEEEEESIDGEEEEDDPQAAETTTRTFVVLLGMLSVLHRRIKTKYPSRFLETTLRTILAAYRPDRLAMTTAVLGLVRSLSANKRPLPPLRRSESHLMTLDQAMPRGSPAVNETKGASADRSTPEPGALVRETSAIGQVASNTDQTDESAVSMPDPEAEDLVDPAEGAVQQRLLQSFVTCILEAYVNANGIAWAPRLFEHYHPNKTVPGRPTALQSFREEPDLVARDSTVGKLVVSFSQCLFLTTGGGAPAPPVLPKNLLTKYLGSCPRPWPQIFRCVRAQREQRACAPQSAGGTEHRHCWHWSRWPRRHTLVNGRYNLPVGVLDIFGGGFQGGCTSACDAHLPGSLRDFEDVP